MPRAQASVELMVILAVALVVFGIVFMMAQKFYISSQIGLKTINARSSLREIRDAADLVYSQGDGAKTRVFVTIPEGVESTEISDDHLLMRLNLAERVMNIMEFSDACLIGDIPTAAGSYWITLESTGGCVRVGESVLSVNPDFLSFDVRAEDPPTSEDIEVINSGNTSVDVSLTLVGEVSSWTSVNPENLTIPDYGTNNSIITIDPPSDTSAGHYYGQIVINNSETHYVDVSVLVRRSASVTLQPDSWYTTVQRGGSDTQGWTACNTGSSTLYGVTLQTTGSGNWLTFTGGTNLGDIAPGNCVYKDSTLNVPVGATPGENPGTVTASNGASDASSITVNVQAAGTTTTSTTTTTTTIGVVQTLSDTCDIDQVRGGSCDVTFTNFLTAGCTLSSVNLDAYIWGDVGAENEEADILADGTGLTGRTECCDKAGWCSDGCTTWNACPGNSYDVTSYSTDDSLIITCDASRGVNELVSGCTSYMECNATITITEICWSTTTSTISTSTTLTTTTSTSTTLTTTTSTTSSTTTTSTTTTSTLPALPSDDFEGGGWSGGSGWLYNWYHIGDSEVRDKDGPHGGKYHLRLRRSTGYVDRALDLSGKTTARARFWVKVDSFESGDEAYFRVSPDDVHWYTVKTWTSADSDKTYHYYDLDLSSYPLSSEFWIAFQAGMSAGNDKIYVDDLEIVGA